MSVIQTLLKEMDHEAKTTRKMLERVPDDKYSWKPHQKSMTVQRLATHIAELPTWASMVLTTSELDFCCQSVLRLKTSTKQVTCLNILKSH